MPDYDGDLVVDVTIHSDDFPGECYGTMPPLAEVSCRYILNRMSADHDETFFGPRNGLEVEVVLPYTIVSRE